MTATAAPSYQIQGTTVTLPCEVRDAGVAALTFSADRVAVQGLLPKGLAPLTLPTGRALVSLSMIDYRDNDLGDYDELSIASYVRRDGTRDGRLSGLRALASGSAGTFIHHLPVTQPFTCEAGRTIWGFPKTVEEGLGITYGDGRMSVRWEQDGDLVVAFSAPNGGKRVVKPVELETFTEIDGRLHTTSFTTGGSAGRLGRGGTSLELGNHPLAQELAGLRLSPKPLFWMTIDRMQGRFDAARQA